MRLLLLSSLLFSFQAFSQVDVPIIDPKFDMGVDFIGAHGGPGAKVNLGLNSKHIGVNGAFGDVNNKGVGFVDITYHSEGTLANTKKFRLVADWTLFEFQKSALSTTIDALFKVKFGPAYDKTRISYTLSPMSTFEARGSMDTRAALSQGPEIEQQIGDKWKLLAAVRHAKIYDAKGDFKSGESVKGRAEAGYKMKNGFTVLAFYEIENYDYDSIDLSIANDPRTIQHKDKLAVVGVGLRGSLNLSKKGKSH